MDVTSPGKKIKYGALSLYKTSAPLTLKTRSLSTPNAMRMHALTPVYGKPYCNVRLSAQSSIKRESHPALCEAHVQVLRLSALLLAMQVPLELQHIDPASRPLLQHMV